MTIVLYSCGNGAASYRGQRIYLQDRDDVYSKFDMSIFRGIEPEMTYHEMVEIVGEPNDFHDYREPDEDFHSPLYYGKEGKVEVSWYKDTSKKEEIGLISYYPFNNVKFTVEDFAHNVQELNIDKTKKSFAVYVDDLMYFIVFHKEGVISKIEYWYSKERYF